MEDEQLLIWRKSRRSGSGNGGGDNCVEVATLPGTVMVRDSKDADGPRLTVTPAEWARFVAGLR